MKGRGCKKEAKRKASQHRHHLPDIKLHIVKHNPTQWKQCGAGTGFNLTERPDSSTYLGLISQLIWGYFLICKKIRGGRYLSQWVVSKMECDKPVCGTPGRCPKGSTLWFYCCSKHLHKTSLSILHLRKVRLQERMQLFLCYKLGEGQSHKLNPHYLTAKYTSIPLHLV